MELDIGKLIDEIATQRAMILSLKLTFIDAMEEAGLQVDQERLNNLWIRNFRVVADAVNEDLSQKLGVPFQARPQSPPHLPPEFEEWLGRQFPS